MGLGYFASETSASTSFGVTLPSHLYLVPPLSFPSTLLTLSPILPPFFLYHLSTLPNSCPISFPKSFPHSFPHSFPNSFPLHSLPAFCIISSLQMVVLLAGVLGTPAGGLLADYCQNCQEYVPVPRESDNDDNHEYAEERDDLGDVVVVVDLESSTSSSSSPSSPSSPQPLLSSPSDGHYRDRVVGLGDTITSTTTSTGTNKDGVYANVNRGYPNGNDINHNANGVNNIVSDSIGLIHGCSDLPPSSDPLISEQEIFEQRTSGQHVSFSNNENNDSSPTTTTTTTNFHQLKIMMMIVAVSTFSATICLCSTYWVTSRVLFMLLVTGGCMLVFLCNPAVRALYQSVVIFVHFVIVCFVMLCLLSVCMAAFDWLTSGTNTHKYIKSI